MKSVKVFFNEQTILNMPFILRLIRRYWVLGLAILVSVVSYTTYQFYFQNTIYSAEKRFRVHVDGQGHPSAAIADLIGGGRRQGSSQDIKAVAQSRGYQELLARALIDSPNFEKLDLRGLNARGEGDYLVERSRCEGDIHCLRVLVTDRVSDFVIVEEVGNAHHMFSLKVITADSFTTRYIAEQAQEALVQYRLNQLSEYTEYQFRVTRDVLNQNKGQLHEAGYRDLLLRLNQITREQDDIRGQFRETFSTYQRMKFEVESLYEHYHATVKARNIQGDIERSGRVDRLNRLKASIEKTRGDINALELSFRSPAAVDNQIISSLRVELARKLEEYQRLSGGEESSTSQMFQVNPQRNLELDYRVANEQFKRVEIDYNQLILRTRELASERATVEASLEYLQATNELVKSLEERLLQLEIAASTVAPDISFLDISLSVQAFKRITMAKYLLFTSFFSFFFLVTGYFIRYAFDSRIYDSYELIDIFGDVPIVGTAPKFKSAT